MSRPAAAGAPVSEEPPLDELIASLTVDVPDYPEPGVLFRDLTPVFADGPAFRRMVEGLAAPGASDPRAAAIAEAAGPDSDAGFDVVVGVEARGFLLAAAVALGSGVGVVPVRKAGKLPRERIAADYALEYGTATLELHADSIRPGSRVLVVDDVLATGGTLGAAIALVERLGGIVTAVSVVVELAALGGRQRLAPHTVHTLWTT
ncbi:adenine phosphoribosyltransferase [Blastococcus mobilis]|uniref:Adenine phosphoribosyltransferase n=1 Tax=Blastococcus mobilis TaxID=1938746 RepID=A0A238VE96_9ACTN|nr:adenine phosphoribosyltransferase [Blastococcus mobilis]SNR32488.1 adenine phosphoribosyltransferase [Blastococcus mobilis]